MSESFNDDMEPSGRMTFIQRRLNLRRRCINVMRPLGMVSGGSPICKIQSKSTGISVDLFALRLNKKKLQKYVSFRPEPSAFAVDAFSFRWTDEFSLIPRILQKLEEDEAETIMIAPL